MEEWLFDVPHDNMAVLCVVVVFCLSWYKSVQDWQKTQLQGKRLSSMSIEISQVEHVADLARLQLSHEELERFSTQLSRILTYVEELNAVETAGIPVTTSVVAGDVNVLREDEVHPSLSQGHALHNAPDAVDGLFQVPQIIADQ